MEASNVHELIIFNRTGLCMYHHDLHKSKIKGDLAGLIDCDKPSKEMIGKQKLIFGLVWSLVSFSDKISCEAPGQLFKSFSTNQFSFHFFDVPTGLKIVLLTNPTNAIIAPSSGVGLAPTSPFSLSHLCQSSSEQNSDKINLKLREFYSDIYIPLITRNVPFCPVQQRIKSQVFSM